MLCSNRKSMNASQGRGDKATAGLYICEFRNKALFVSLNHLCSWKQTLTWKTFLFLSGGGGRGGGEEGEGGGGGGGGWGGGVGSGGG